MIGFVNRMLSKVKLRHECYSRKLNFELLYVMLLLSRIEKRILKQDASSHHRSTVMSARSLLGWID